MPDFRTRREKLEAMAAQTESPHEASVAREKLKKIGVNPDEPLGKKTKARPEYDARREPLWNSEWFKKWAEDFTAQNRQAGSTYRRTSEPWTRWEDMYGPPFSSSHYADDDPMRNTTRQQADEMYRRTRDQWRDESRKKFDHEVRFVGGPNDGQVHADPRNAYYRVMKTEPINFNYKVDEDPYVTYTEGEYSREVDGEGKPFYLWRGWRKR